jgi:DNA-binding transcriptional ArsR family regulator
MRRFARPKPPSDLPRLRTAAAALKMLGDASRIHLLLLTEDEPQAVEFLSEAIGQSQPVTSHHLALLYHGNFMNRKRCGRQNLYSTTRAGDMLLKAARCITDI